MQIAENTIVAIHYTLTNAAGEKLDSSAEQNEPLTYLHGHGNIIPGLESALLGKQAGDTLNVEVAPQDGYGEHHEQMIQQVPRSAFEGVDTLEPGMQFQADTGAGMRLFTITTIAGDEVTIDGNHPLAGETLNFDVEVVEVRDASAEEIEHGHAHGAGGHEH